MNKYGQTAVKAVKLLQDKATLSPGEAWEAASSQIFGKGTPSQKKGCPRNAFLGLCEDGWLKGVQPGKYTNSKKNKQYAIDAIKELRKQPKLANDPISLWKAVMHGDPKSHNEQMYVVTALWEKGLIK